MKKLLPLFLFAVLLTACKEDTSTITESQAAPASTEIEDPSNTQTAQSSSIKNKTEVVATTAANSEVKPNATIKVKSSNQVVSSVAHNNSMTVSIPKAPTRLMDNYPFDVDLKTVDGSIVNSSEVFKKNGKPTVVLFWLTTCRPCQMKMDAIKPLYPEWQEEVDFNVVAISGDYPRNYPKFVEQVKSKGWEWDTYNDVNRSFKGILPGGLNGYPQTFIFDKNGELVYQDRKFTPGDELALFYEIKRVSPAT